MKEREYENFGVCNTLSYSLNSIDLYNMATGPAQHILRLNAKSKMRLFKLLLVCAKKNLLIVFVLRK